MPRRKSRLKVRKGERISDREEWIVCFIGSWGWPHHKALAREMYGEERVSRISTILRRNNISTRDARNFETDESREYLNDLFGEAQEDWEEEAAG